MVAEETAPDNVSGQTIEVRFSRQQIGVLLMLLDHVALEGIETKVRAAEAQAALLQGLQMTR